MISPGVCTAGWLALIATSKKDPPCCTRYDSDGPKTATSPRVIVLEVSSASSFTSPKATMTRSTHSGTCAKAHGAASRVTRTYSFSSTTSPAKTGQENSRSKSSLTTYLTDVPRIQRGEDNTLTCKGSAASFYM